MKNYITGLSPQTVFQYLMVFLVTYFLSIQAWDQSPTTNAAIATWIIGLISWSIKRESLLSQGQKKIIAFSVAVFIACVLSWLLSDYDLNVKKIEPDVRFLLFGLTVIAVSHSQLTINQLTVALIISGLSYGCSAIYEHHILGMGRVNGDENAVTYGNGSMLIAACLAFTYFSNIHKSLKILVPIAIVFALISAVYAGTRGSFFALVPLSIFILYRLNNKGRIGFLIVFCLLVTLLFSFTDISKRFEKAQTNISSYINNGNTFTSAGVRLNLWKSASCMFQQNTAFGVGPRRFKDAMNASETTCAPEDPRLRLNNQAHNLYFNTLATKGLIGFLALLSFFTAIIYYSYKEKAPARHIALAAVLAMLSYGLTVDLLFKSFMADRHLILLAILIGLRERKE